MNDRRREINQMADDLHSLDRCLYLSKEDCYKTECEYCEAEALYNAGYRKQSDGCDFCKNYDFNRVAIIECFGVKEIALTGGHRSNEEGRFKFCPNCGAEMKGESK